MLTIQNFPGVPVGASPVQMLDPILDSAEGWYPFALIPDTDPVVIGSSAKTTVSLTVPGDCMLLIESARFHSTISTWPNGSWGCSIQISRNGNSSLMNKAVRAELFCGWGGGGELAFLSKYPWLLTNQGGQGQLQLDFTDKSNTTHTCQFALVGRRREFRS